jgi:glutathione S-transferase
MGKTPKEEALVMMLCEQAHDLRLQFNGLCYGPKGDSDADQKQFLETTATDHLQQIDAYLGKHKGKFAVGDQPTVADFQLFDYLDSIFAIDHGHIVHGKFANIEKLLKTIRQLPELKDYIAKSQSELPLNNKGEYYA